VRLSFKQEKVEVSKLKETLIELLTLLFQRDEEVIDDIIEKFDYEEDHFIKPPTDVNRFAEDMLYQNESPDVNCEFVKGLQHTEEIESAGIKIPEGTIELWFKFKDVKLKRRKIYRLGDYHLRLINTGFDKWTFQFFIEQDGIIGNELKEGFVLANHPHISNGNPCLAAMETAIRASITNYNFNGFLWRIRTFLSSWNYRSPYWEPERFEYPSMVEHSNASLTDAFVLHNEEWPIQYRIHRAEYLRPDTTSKRPLMLTSARKKLYDTSPISRTLLHVQNYASKYLDDEMNMNSSHSSDSFISYNLGMAVKRFIVEDITINQGVVLAEFWFQKIRSEVANNSMLIQGSWLVEYDDLVAKMFNIRVKSTFYTNTYDTHYSFHDASYRLLKATRQDDNPDTFARCSSLLDTVQQIKSYLETLRDYDEDSGLNPSQIQVKVHEELHKLINIRIDEFCSGEQSWLNVTDFLDYVNNYEYESNAAVKIMSEEIEKAKKDFEPLKQELLELITEWKIKYHKQELRRLGDNERTNTVQIEHLNL